MDFIRKELIHNFICAECGAELTLSLDDKRIYSDSADNIKVKIKVNLCKKCIEKYKKPFDRLKEVWDLIGKAE